MAARKRKLLLTDDWKAKIQASQIVNRLAKLVDGEIDMTATQVRAAEILLKKTIPDLSRTTVGGDPEAPIGISVNVGFVASKHKETPENNAG
jgi:hypothetical protein